MVKTYRVIISRKAQSSVKQIHDYIKEESHSSAKNVKEKIFEKIRSLQNHPEKFSKEPLLDSLEGNYRSVSIWDYKIIYKISNEVVKILIVINGKRSEKTILKKISE